MRVDNTSQNWQELGRMLRVSRIAPDPPRGLAQKQPGVLSWEPPANLNGITHYRVYLNSDGAESLALEVPAGQTQVFVLFANDALVSSYCAPTGTESNLVRFGEVVDGRSAATVTSIRVSYESV